MNSGPQFLDIIILFVIAVLLISRLRSVLGTRSDDEEPIIKDLLKEKSHKVIDLKEVKEVVIESKVIDENDSFFSLTSKIKVKDPDFDEQEFIEGAKIAFEMIIKSYAQGDFEVLKNLLADEVLKSFTDAIEKRKQHNETMECELIGFNNVTVLSSDLINNTAKITVKFESEQVNLIKNQEDNIISGDPSYIENITDLWTFSRDLTSNNPNWKLTATRSN